MAVVEQTVAPERLLAVEQAIDAFAEGGFVLVHDDLAKEHRGVLLLAAEHAHEGALKQLLDHTSGMVCVALPHERAERLRLPRIVAEEESTGLLSNAFTVPVDLLGPTTTGLSALDRALTVQALADPHTTPEQLGRPGHVFPVCAVPGGVMERQGNAEAAVDLSRLAGLSGVTAIGAVVTPDWEPAGYEDLNRLAASRLLPLISVADLVAYRLARKALARKGLSPLDLGR
ncbi:3,4-dihydroxy-2-butanone-4-phosphate synthase [Streptomyces sp. ME19-01-6]|uniref:3,4-dihydroxy-2-butanone-4-phosphate synthase n=1 Tax=Streptomyces sp. ME19-01-6 TaxID=3028686 RepID=UPI0029B8E845|nr:3,4-dihydroxy-2-butanone-4-phosphate synthase [Streptomyces sp. ME19-01-6]MDX3226862.1 3,4-dihydroxy-2-butanone-4-phosphate synthase [Streptomyces sp. ME19-01-6]